MERAEGGGYVEPNRDGPASTKTYRYVKLAYIHRQEIQSTDRLQNASLVQQTALKGVKDGWLLRHAYAYVREEYGLD